MSADNTILILDTRGEYRVEHIQGVDNLWFSWRSKFPTTEPTCARVLEYFMSSTPISSASDVLLKAQSLYDDLEYVEYGIQTVSINKTFREIVDYAIVELREEIRKIPSYGFSNGKESDIIKELKNTIYKAQEYLDTKNNKEEA